MQQSLLLSDGGIWQFKVLHLLREEWSDEGGNSNNMQSFPLGIKRQGDTNTNGRLDRTSCPTIRMVLTVSPPIYSFVFVQLKFTFCLWNYNHVLLHPFHLLPIFCRLAVLYMPELWWTWRWCFAKMRGQNMPIWPISHVPSNAISPSRDKKTGSTVQCTISSEANSPISLTNISHSF